VVSLPLVWLYEGEAFQIELLLHIAKLLCTAQGLRTLKKAYFGFAAFFTLVQILMQSLWVALEL